MEKYFFFFIFNLKYIGTYH